MRVVLPLCKSLKGKISDPGVMCRSRFKCMKTTYFALLILHVLLVFAIAIWLLAWGRDEVKRIPKWFTSLTVVTMILSLALILLNLLQHNEDTSIDLLNPSKYATKTLVFAVLLLIAVKNYKKSIISQRVWLAMIGLMAVDLVITGVWM